ncbi:MAG: hypothetical protein LVT47_08430 [Cyanobacteria bacterium LVE1205-1]
MWKRSHKALLYQVFPEYESTFLQHYLVNPKSLAVDSVTINAIAYPVQFLPEV